MSKTIWWVVGGLALLWWQQQPAAAADVQAGAPSAPSATNPREAAIRQAYHDFAERDVTPAELGYWMTQRPTVHIADMGPTVKEFIANQMHGAIRPAASPTPLALVTRTDPVQPVYDLYRDHRADPLLPTPEKTTNNYTDTLFSPLGIFRSGWDPKKDAIDAPIQ